MSKSLVPRKAERLLELLGADTEFRMDVLGDLAEEYAIREQWDGPAYARRWYYREALRVAPYLLRDRWRAAERRDVVDLARALVWPSLCIVATEFVLMGVGAGRVMELAIRAELPSVAAILLPLTMLSWTACVASTGGYLAARFSRRAPVAGLLVLSGFWTMVMIFGQSPAVPLWFRIANGFALLLGIATGGLVRTLRSRIRRTLA